MRDCSDQQSSFVLLEATALSAGQINLLPDHSSRVRAETVVIQYQSIVWTFHLRHNDFALLKVYHKLSLLC